MSETPRKDVPLAFDRTLRDEMAIQFMAAWMSDNVTLKEVNKDCTAVKVKQEDWFAKLAYQFADALLREREREMTTAEAAAPTTAPTTYGYTTKDTLVKIDHVGLVLDGKIILRDVNAEIVDIDRADCVQGQVICFLGPSGIGKTRLSRIIAGLDQPTTGRVLVDGTGHLAEVHKGMVGMVPQNYPLFEFQTVEQNLRTAAEQSRQPTHALGMLQDFVSEFELKEHLNKYPIQLSGGTRQRVAIVRQLLCAEHFIVMDEPFSGLDPIMKSKACELITKVANLDTLNTIILVTHDITEGMAVADHVWIMGRERAPFTDRDGTAVMLENAWLPGATLVDIIDFAQMGICWRPDIYQNPDFLAEVAKVKARFQTLVPR